MDAEHQLVVLTFTSEADRGWSNEEPPSVIKRLIS